MCESCERNLNRRQFVATTAALGAFSLAGGMAWAHEEEPLMRPRDKKPASVMVVFLHPRPEDYDQGKAESYWQEHHWHSYPGNQYRHAEQRAKFAAKIKAIAQCVGVEVDIHPGHLDTSAKARQYAARIKAQVPDAVLVVCLARASKKWSYDLVKAVGAPGIVYLPTGADHQVPSQYLTDTPGLHLINSIENWDEIDRALRAVAARKRVAQSRVLRVAERGDGASTDKLLGFETVCIAATEYNDLFDSIKPDEAMRRSATEYKKRASRVMDVTDDYLVEAFRAHRCVDTLLRRYGGDAITIKCLFLQHRKPCLSFSIHNGQLVPCGCENDLNATLTMLLGSSLFGRAGFQHNPGYDTVRNHYYGTHCTCATELQGPEGAAQDFLIRPFFHHLPKTPALDVQWTPGAPVLLMKYAHGPEPSVHGWTGKVIESPKCPPAGGCATRVLVAIDKADEITSVYAGAHPILYCVDPEEARCLKIFARLYQIEQGGNIV